MGRKSIREQRRKEILDALYRCLLRKPYNETTIKDIGEEAGINHAMLHYYFRSKEDILLCFIDSIYEHYRVLSEREAARFRGKALTPRDTLRHVFRFMNTQITTDKKLQTIFVEIWEIALFNRAVNARVKKIYTDWISELGKAMPTLSRDPAMAHRLAMSLVAFQEGIGLFSVFFNMKKKDSLVLMETFQDRIIEMLD